MTEWTGSLGRKMSDACEQGNKTFGYYTNSKIFWLAYQLLTSQGVKRSLSGKQVPAASALIMNKRRIHMAVGEAVYSADH